MDITVKNYFHRGSARKIRPILAVIRRKNANKAMESLKFMNKNGANELYKMIKNGVSQAEENNLDPEKLFIKKIQCDKAKELKRHRFESKGRVARIQKHQHHIFVVLSDEITSIGKKAELKPQAKEDLNKSVSKKEK